MIKAVIFDFDGTLMNTLPGIAHFCNTALKEVGLPPIETDKFRYFVGNGRDVLIHRILDHYNADTPDNYEKAGKKYDDEYENDILYGTVIYDGIMDLIGALKKDGIKVGILTNKPHDVAVQIIKTVFGDSFDIYYGQREGIPTKPSPDGALAIARELGFKAEECAFAGDTIVDVTTGKKAEMYTIGVLWGFRDEDELKAADAIAKEPKDIYDIIKKVK
jgi:phosphoglycolate phosphatase